MEDKKQKGKILRGVVVSDKMKDTVVVSVNVYKKHPKYGKYIKTTKRYKAHDEGNQVKVGERVEIVETRPISKDKHFKIIEVRGKKLEDGKDSNFPYPTSNIH